MLLMHLIILSGNWETAVGPSAPQASQGNVVRRIVAARFAGTPQEEGSKLERGQREKESLYLGTATSDGNFLSRGEIF